MSDPENTTAAPAADASAATPEITQAPKPKPHYFSRFTMSAVLTVNGQARPDIESKLMFGVYRENPRLVVKTNDPNDEGNSYGKITAAMDPMTWAVLAQHVEDLVKNPQKDIKVIKNFNLYKGNQKFDEPQHVNTTLIGREEDGRIYIKIIEDGRPTPTFYFGPPKFHALIRMDKSEMPSGEASQMYALAGVRMLTQIFAASMGKRDDGEQDDAAARTPDRSADRQGGGGGWGNRQGGGGGGGWQGRQGGGGGGFQRGG